MENKNRYPEHIMKTLRQGRGLEPNDTSEDKEINTYSPNEAFDGMLHWEGIINYTDTIKYWIESIYGIDLDTIETEDSLDSLLEDDEMESEDDDCIGIKPDLSYLSNYVLPRFKETGDL